MIRKPALTVVLGILIMLVTSLDAHEWTLQQCIDQALSENRNLLISKNNIKISEQNRKTAETNFLPKLTVVADYRYYSNQPYQLLPLGTDGQYKESPVGVPHNINANFQATLPLYSPQLFNIIQIAKIAAEHSELQYIKVEEQVYVEVCLLYYNAQIIHYQLALTTSNFENTKKLLKNMQLLKEQRLAKGTDVSKIQLQADQLSTQIELLNSKYDQVINTLKFTLGLSITQNLEIEVTVHYQDKPEYVTASIIELRLAKMQSNMISNELQALINSGFPSISLFGTYGTTGFGYDQQPTHFLKFFPIGFVGIQVSFPLLEFGTQTKITQKEIELCNSELKLQVIYDQNTLQLENANRQKTVAKKTIITALSHVQLAQTVYEQTILQQQQGQANLTEVLLANNALSESQQTYLSVIIEYLKSDLEQKKLTGNIPKRSTYEKQ